MANPEVASSGIRITRSETTQEVSSWAERHRLRRSFVDVMATAVCLMYDSGVVAGKSGVKFITVRFVFKGGAYAGKTLGSDFWFDRVKANGNPSGLLTLASWPHMYDLLATLHNA